MLNCCMRILTGIKPTGILHIGNYFGSIKQLLTYQNHTNDEIFAFIANAHALTNPISRSSYEMYTKSLLAGYLASGINPKKVCIYKQTDIPETFELSWILMCFCTKGVLDRAHAYKSFKDNQKDNDSGIGAGVYTYPILMAADILGTDCDIVPVGIDQKQHVEICRDLAIKINHHITSQGLQNVFKVPEIQIEQEQSIIGIDGRKMSKSYDNTIGLFEDEQTLHKLIFGIKTDSSGVAESKVQETLFQLYSIFASEQEIAELGYKYVTGIGWGEVKKIVFQKINDFISPIREKYKYYMTQDKQMEDILKYGADKVRPITQQILHNALHGIGL